MCVHAVSILPGDSSSLHVFYAAPERAGGSTTVGVPAIAAIARIFVNGCDVTPAGGRDFCHVSALFRTDACDSSVPAVCDFCHVRYIFQGDFCHVGHVVINYFEVPGCSMIGL